MEQLLGRLALSPGQVVRYREEISHPALERPEIAEGTMSVNADGRLVRDQLLPERQISEIGESILTTRPGPGAEPTLYPIPDELQPMLSAIRGVLAGDIATIEAGFAIGLGSGDAGWTLALRPRVRSSVAKLVFGGCGPVLQRMGISGRDGVRRVVTFLPLR